MGGIEKIKLGSQGLQVSAQGLGCMGMSAFYGPPKPDSDMIALIHHAVQKGITFLDTSDIYGPFTNEILVGKALKEGGGIRDKVELATKFGMSFANGKFEVKGDPAYVRAACEASLKRLQIDSIDLYYQHRIDTSLPIEVTVGELKKLVEEGKIKYIGLSEASASTIRRAHAVHPITAVQLEWSLWTRDVEEEIVPTCRELGIGIVAYSPLGRGFFSSGPKMVESLSDNDFRKVVKDGSIIQTGKYEKLIEDQDGELSKQMTAHRQSVSQVSSSEHNTVGPYQRNKSEITEEKSESNNSGHLSRKVQEQETEFGGVKWRVYSTFTTLAYKGYIIPLVLICQVLF